MSPWIIRETASRSDILPTDLACRFTCKAGVYSETSRSRTERPRPERLYKQHHMLVFRGTIVCTCALIYMYMIHTQSSRLTPHTAHKGQRCSQRCHYQLRCPKPSRLRSFLRSL